MTERDARQQLDALLAAGRAVRSAEADIYSALPEATAPHHYDRFAGLYDVLVGNRLYNRLVWGTSPDDYLQFARACLAAPAGPHLDAGCGSMLFTAAAYVATARPIIAIDQSIAMLRRARQRLRQACGRVPDHVLLLQADLFDLPFRPRQFASVLSMGILHLFTDGAAMVAAVQQMLAPDAALYLTTLIANDRRGDRYLRFLQRNDEVACVRTLTDVARVMTDGGAPPQRCEAKGNMAYVVSSAADA